MKILSKIIFLILSIGIFFTDIQTSFAQATPTLTATVSGTTITATATGNSAKINELLIISRRTQFQSDPVCKGFAPVAECLSQPQKVVSGNKVTWTIKNLAGGTVYYLRAEESPNEVSPAVSNVVEIKTGAETIDAKWPLGYVSSGTTAYFDGKINNINIADFNFIQLEYSVTPLTISGNTPPDMYAPVPAQTDKTANALPGVNSDGTYFFKLKDLTPSQTYSFRQTIKTKNGASEIKVGSFNASKGITPEGSTSQQKSFNERSYRLLAPLPGLEVVLDNDLCREYLTQGKPVPGGSCDNQISYFINLLITLLIGISAVVLVIQLIIQGYQYMVTDIPFLKASAKSRFFDALLGLLLALSSYLILNTINPKLVSSDLNVAGIDISLDEESDANDFETFSSHTGGTITASKCVGGLVSIPQGIEVKNSVDNKMVCKNFAPKLVELKSKTPSVSWRITSTTNGRHSSQCHKKGTQKTGNCLDIALVSGGSPVPANDPRWGTLCQALASISDITFLNEASKTPGCENIKKNTQTKYGSGSHLHVVYIGN